MSHLKTSTLHEPAFYNVVLKMLVVFNSGLKKMYPLNVSKKVYPQKSLQLTLSNVRSNIVATPLQYQRGVSV